MWEPTDLGKLSWDDSFDITKESSQQFVFDFCQDLLSETRAQIVKDRRVDCWIINFKDWIQADTRNRGVWPVPELDFYTRLTEYIRESEQGQMEANNFEIGLDETGLMKYMYISCTAVGNPSSVYE